MLDYLGEIRQSGSFADSLPPSFEEARSAAVHMDVSPRTGAEDVEMLLPVAQSVAAGSLRRRERAMLPPTDGQAELAGSLRPGDAAPVLSPVSAVSLRSGHSAASTRGDAHFGCELIRSGEMSRRDTLAEEGRLRRGERNDPGVVNIVGNKRKRSSVWEVGRRVARKLSLTFRIRKSLSPKTPAGGVISGVRQGGEGTGEGATPLLTSPEVAEIEHAVEPRDADQADEYDGIINAYPLSPPPRYRSPSAASFSPLSRASSTHSRSSAHWLSSPHPEYATDGSYIDALTSRVWERHQRMVFDEDQIDFRFAGASGNQNDGESSLFYPGSDIGDAVSSSDGRSRRRGSQEVLLEEIRAYGPSWARGWRLELDLDLDVVGEESS